jgi:hypothetical protein
MSTWKDFERRMCRRFLAARIPVAASGYGGTLRHGRDGESFCGRFDYQMKKVRGASVNDLIVWLVGVVQTAATRKRIGVLVYNRAGDQDAESLVVLRADQWEQVLDLLERADRLAELEAALEKRGQTVGDLVARLSAEGAK